MSFTRRTSARNASKVNERLWRKDLSWLKLKKRFDFGWWVLVKIWFLLMSLCWIWKRFEVCWWELCWNKTLPKMEYEWESVFPFPPPEKNLLLKKTHIHNSGDDFGNNSSVREVIWFWGEQGSYEIGTEDLKSFMV